MAMAEIARREGISERGLRRYVRNLIARRAPEATGEFTALQMSRLNEALLMSFGTMSRTNLPAVDQVVRIVRELDHYQGLGRGARQTRRKLLKVSIGSGMAPVTPPFAESRSREAYEDAAADGTPDRRVSPTGFPPRAGRQAGRRVGELQLPSRGEFEMSHPARIELQGRDFWRQGCGFLTQGWDGCPVRSRRACRLAVAQDRGA